MIIHETFGKVTITKQNGQYQARVDCRVGYGPTPKDALNDLRKCVKVWDEIWSA